MQGRLGLGRTKLARTLLVKRAELEMRPRRVQAVGGQSHVQLPSGPSLMIADVVGFHDSPLTSHKEKIRIRDAGDIHLCYPQPNILRF